MGLFGNKNRDLKKTNQFVIDQLIEKITNIISESKDFKANDALNNLRSVLRGQAASGSDDSFVFLNEIEKKVDEARKNIVLGRTNNALNLISEAASIATERASEIQNTGGDLTKRDEKKQRKADKAREKAEAIAAKKKKQTENPELARLQEKKKAAQDEQQYWFEEEQRLLGILRTLPVVDRNIERQMKEAAKKAAQAAQRVNMFDAEILRVNQINDVKQNIEDYQDITANRTVSDNELERLKQQHSETMEARKEDAFRQRDFVEQTKDADVEINALNDEIASIYYGETTETSTANPYAQSNSYATANANPYAQSNPYATGGASANSNPYATGGASAQSNPYATGGSNPYAQANPYGNNNNSPLGSKSDINKMISILTQSQAEYNKKLQKAQGELSDFDAELRSLLRRRQNATPSECLVLDGEIDQKKAQRATLTRTIQVYQNQNAQLSEQLAMMGKVEVQQDLEAVKSRIQQLTGGRYADIEGLSMYLKEAAQKENEELERFGVANSVADSEEINTRTMTGNNSDYMDSVNVKDEDKYAALEAELGLATR